MAGVPPCISCFFVARFLGRVWPEEKNYTELEQRLYTELEQRLQYFFYVLHVKRPPTTVIRPELYSEGLALYAADPELHCLCYAVLGCAKRRCAVLCCAVLCYGVSHGRRTPPLQPLQLLPGFCLPKIRE